MSDNDPRDERLWIPAFDELAAGLQKAAMTRGGARHYLAPRTWLIAAIALAIVPGGLALALSNQQTDVPAFSPAPPPLETQIGSTVTCENGDVLKVTEADFRRAVAALPPIPAQDPARVDPVPVTPPEAPLGYRFVCGSNGDMSVVAINK